MKILPKIVLLIMRVSDKKGEIMNLNLVRNMNQTPVPEFDIDVCRTGFGFATIKVKAENEFEAGQIALDRAGNYDYNEKHSDYTLSNPVENPKDKDSSSGDSRKLRVIFDMQSNGDVGPIDGVVFEYSQTDLNKLEKLQGFVIENEIGTAGFDLYPDAWLYGKDKNSYSEKLSTITTGVSESFVTISGYIPRSASQMSARVDIEHLKQAFKSGVETLVVSSKPYDFLNNVSSLNEVKATGVVRDNISRDQLINAVFTTSPSNAAKGVDEVSLSELDHYKWTSENSEYAERNR